MNPVLDLFIWNAISAIACAAIIYFIIRFIKKKRKKQLASR